MSEALNEIHAYFGKLNTTTTAPVKQWAYGQKLVIHDADLPNVFEAYYSNSRSRGTADPQIGTNGVVDAPHAYFRSGADIYVFLMVHEGTDDGRYNKIVHIPINPCPEPTDVEPEPYEQGVIDQAIAALNQAVTQTGQDVISADASARAASQSAGNAAESERQAGLSAQSADNSKTAAEQAQAKAEEAQGKAEDAQSAAELAQGKAEDAKQDSETAKREAEQAAGRAEQAAASIAPVDPTLSITGRAADAKATGDRLDSLTETVGGKQNTLTFDDAPTSGSANPVKSGGVYAAVETKISKPLTNPIGTNGQLLRTLGNGQTEWTDQGLPTDEQTAQAVSDWLDDHPEATTTVEDGAITWPKLYSDVQTEINKKAPAILRQTTTAAISHTIEGSDLKIVSFVGNQYAFETAKCVNRKNYMVNMVSDTVTLRGVTIGRSGDKFYTLNGTATANGEEYLLWLSNNADIPAGEYKLYFKVNTGNSIIKDENHTLIVSITSDDGSSYRLVESAKIDSDITIPFTAANHIKRILIKIGVLKGDVFDGYTGWFGIYPADATFYDSNTVVNNGDTYNYGPPSFDGSYVEGYMHKCNVIYAEDMFLQPERYGAISDGVADDTQALVDCFSAAASSGKQVIGYGTYKTSAPLNISWQNANVYLRNIKYTGDQSAIVLANSGVVFTFHKINSTGNGIEFENSVARKCQVKGNSIYSIGDCIIAQPKTIYNTCEIRYLSSTDSNCIIFPDPESGEFRAGEYVFKDSSCHCPKGYVAHRINASKVYNFTVEGDCKYGYLNPADCLCVGCRHGEQVDHMASRIFAGNDYNNGPLIIFDSYTAFYSTGAFRYYGIGTLPWFAIDLSAIQNYDSVNNGTDWFRLGYNGMTMGVAIRGANARSYENIGGEICFIGNHKVYIPRCRTTRKLQFAEYDMALWESPNDADIAACIPMGGWGTDFITNVPHTDYRMNGSFGAVGYNDLTFEQVNGNTVTVYDKLGNVIFDGTNEGDGKWHLTCSVDPSSQGRMTESVAWWCYDGTNEVWNVEKIG